MADWGVNPICRTQREDWLKGNYKLENMGTQNGETSWWTLCEEAKETEGLNTHKAIREIHTKGHSLTKSGKWDRPKSNTITHWSRQTYILGQRLGPWHFLHLPVSSWCDLACLHRDLACRQLVWMSWTNTLAGAAVLSGNKLRDAIIYSQFTTFSCDAAWLWSLIRVKSCVHLKTWFKTKILNFGI